MIIHNLLHHFFSLAWLQIGVFIALVTICLELFFKFGVPMLNEEIASEAEHFKQKAKELENSKKKLLHVEQQTLAQQQKIEKLELAIKSWQQLQQIETASRDEAFKLFLSKYQEQKALTLQTFQIQQHQRQAAKQAHFELTKKLQDPQQPWPDLLKTTINRWKANE